MSLTLLLAYLTLFFLLCCLIQPQCGCMCLVLLYLVVPCLANVSGRSVNSLMRGDRGGGGWVIGEVEGQRLGEGMEENQSQVVIHERRIN